MNYLHVSKQFQDVWLAEKPENPKNHLFSLLSLPVLECHENSLDAKECLYDAYFIEIIRNTFHLPQNSMTFFKYNDLIEKYTEIANMYSNFFGFKYSEDEIENKWKELKAYVEENKLLHLYA